MTREMITETDYIGDDGLLHCGTCGEAKEALYPKTSLWLGTRTHPRWCKCERIEHEREEKEREERRHTQEVERLRSSCFPDRQMWNWAFENDNGRNPQMKKARAYAEGWDEMYSDNKGLLLWGNVGTGKSFLAGSIANALIEKEIPVKMTNFAIILNDLMGSIEGKNEYVRDLTNRYSLLIIDDFGMERGTEFALEQVYNVIDSRWRAQKPLIVTTNLPVDVIKNPPDVPHERIYDRLLEMCTPVQVVGKSMRKDQALRNMDSLKKTLC